MIFFSGLIDPEGPVALPDGSWLCVEGGSRGRVTHIATDGRSSQIVAATGRPNGLAVDGEGYIWVAESEAPSLLRVTLDGRVDVVALHGAEASLFLFPNDLCLGADGAIYMTDSGIEFKAFAPGGKIRGDYAELDYDGREISRRCLDWRREKARFRNEVRKRNRVRS